MPTSTSLSSPAAPAPDPALVRRGRPRSTRRALAAAVAIVVAAVALAGCWSSTQSKVAGLVNSSRTRRGYSRLHGDQLAMDRAQEWSNHMAATGVLAHRGSWSGLGSWCAAGENVGYGPDSVAVEKAFMSSPNHRANILGNYDRVGTGYAKRNGVVWITQIFLRSC